MLVKFDSNVAGEMLMFADVARRLLTLAGKECTARGVITREQIRRSLRAFARRQMPTVRHMRRPMATMRNSNVVSLGQRAQPLHRTPRTDGARIGGLRPLGGSQDFGE